MGSVIPGNAASADAAAERCRKERREKRGMRGLRKGVYQCWCGAGTFARSTRTYWPVPVTLSVCTPGLAESVTVIVLVRVPTALGVNVTVKVHLACAANDEVHGV